MTTPQTQLKSFIEKFDRTNQALIRAARRTIRKRVPTATELVYDNYNFFVIGYSPTLRPSDSVFSIAAAANGVNLYFTHGARLADPHHILRGSGTQGRGLRLPSVDVLDKPEVKQLITAAIDAAKPMPKTGRGKLIIRSISAKQRPRQKKRSRDHGTFVLALAVALHAASAHAQLAGAPGQQVALTISPPESSSFHQSGAQFAVSPDGRFVAVVAIRQGQATLWVQPLGSGRAVHLPSTVDASYPFWSPDARHIGFFANGKLKTTQVDGGAVNVLCDSPDGRGGSWGVDGDIIFTPSPSDVLFRVSSGGGSCTPLTHLAGQTERSHRWPQFLRDGHRFLYLVTYKFGTNRLGEVRIGSLDLSEPVSLGISTASRATYGAGHILFMRDDTLMAVKLDANDQRTVGERFSVAAYVRTDDNLYTSVSASSTGVLLSQQDSAIRKTRLTWMDRNGKVLGFIGEPGQYMNIELAPDDRLVAASLVSGTPGNRDVWVIDGRAKARRLTSNAANDAVPLWSRDNRSIVFESYRNGPPTIFRMASGGSGNEVQLLNSGSNDIPEDWSADGRFVTFTRNSPGTSLDLWILPLNGSEPFPFLATTANEDDARFDRTGRWIAYTSNASGRYEVYVRPFPPAAGEYRVSRDGGRSPIWRADGKELFFLTPDGTLMASAIDSRSGFRSGAPRSLFRTGVSEMITAGNAHQYGVTRDGSRFLINRSDPHDDSTPLTAVLNWPPLSR